MTREEAIKLIDTHTVCFYNEIDSPTLQALHLAIEALQRQTDGDLISRADAIEAVRGLSALVDDKDFSYFEDALKALPSADAVHKPDYSYEADMVRRLKEATQK